METVIVILAIAAGAVGIVGSIVPGLPGPPLGWLGLLLLYLWGHGTDGAGNPLSTKLLLILLGVTVLVTILDYVVPAWLTRRTGGSKAGSWGAVIGLFVGMACFPPWGILVGTMAGAFLFELLFSAKGTGDALQSAWGAFLGFLASTGLKFVTTCVLFYYILVYAF